jgi:hypothetical protein
MKYKFIAIEDEDDNGPGRVIEHTIIGEQKYEELLDHIEDWLRGVGYMFKGHLAIVED